MGRLSSGEAGETPGKLSKNFQRKNMIRGSGRLPSDGGLEEGNGRTGKRGGKVLPVGFFRWGKNKQRCEKIFCPKEISAGKMLSQRMKKGKNHFPKGHCFGREKTGGLKREKPSPKETLSPSFFGTYRLWNATRFSEKGTVSLLLGEFFRRKAAATDYGNSLFPLHQKGRPSDLSFTFFESFLKGFGKTFFQKSFPDVPLTSPCVFPFVLFSIRFAACGKCWGLDGSCGRGGGCGCWGSGLQR